MSITKTFGLVVISDIRTPKTTTPGATPGMIVVYSQGHTTDYVGTRGQSVGKAAVGVEPSTSLNQYSGERKFSEFWSLEELASANGATGLNIGDQLPGISISSLSSHTPFFVGQKAYEKTGLFYSPTLEFGDQPNDRVEEQQTLAAAPADMSQATVAEKAAVEAA